MQAVTYREYGDPLEVLKNSEIDKPTIDAKSVIIEVHAASVNPADWHIVRGDPYIARVVFGLRKPKNIVPGADVAGTIVAIGNEITEYEVGDEVHGEIFDSGLGAFAEYVCTTEEFIQPKPVNLTFEEAACVPLAATTALQGLRDHGKVKEGDKVLIIGASGGVGTFAIQLAKEFGAEVTGVCSTKNLELVRSLGADYVIDYTEEDFTENTDQYDVALQLGGMLPVKDYLKVLKPKGTLILAGGDSNGHIIGPVGRISKAMILAPFVSQNIKNYTAKHKNEDLKFLTELIEQGKIKPVVTKTYGLEETPQAISDVERGHTQGKVVIQIRSTG